jgi:hypothetical protein
LAEGATRINTETPEQGSQGFQGYQGRQGFQGIVGPTGVILHGSDNEVQYNLNQTLTSSPSLSIFDFYPTTPSSGLKGNFLNYSESCRIDNNTYSNGSIINLNFKSYNTYRATNIRLNEDKTLTFSGFNTAGTGETLTLILGYTGASDSKIVIPGTEEIYWSNGPIGNPDGGQQTTLKASPNKKISVFNFFNDGQRTYGNYSTDYEKGV